MPPRLARRTRTGLGFVGAWPVCLVVAGIATATPARAADPCLASPLVSTCINADNLWPHPGPQVFATVGGVETIDEGHFGFALVTDYQSRPIVFNVPLGTGSTAQYAIDNQVNGSFLWAMGVTRRLELDIALPVTFGQNGSGAAPITGSNVPLHTTAIRDMRFGLAYQIVPHSSLDARPAGGDFGVTARFDVSAPVGDRDQFAGDATSVFSPSLAADYRNGRFFAGVEIGARIRPDTADQVVQGANVGTQGTIALGVGYDLLNRAKLLGVMIEARSLPTFATQYTLYQSPTGTTEQTSSNILAPSEWMLSLRSSPLAFGADRAAHGADAPSDDVSITVGGGGELTSGEAGFTAPRFRFLLGLRYAPTPGRHSRGGLVLDLASKADRCKDDPDSADGFKDDDGCPDEDADKDGIDDRYDQCPLDPEDFHGQTDGCPDKPKSDSAKPTKP